MSVKTVLSVPHDDGSSCSYEEVDIQIPTVAEFSVPYLKGDCHSIIAMELFVKTLPRVRFELDRMRESCVSPELDGHQGREQSLQH